MNIPFTKEGIKQSPEDTIRKMNIKYGYVRPVVWRGSEMDGCICPKK